MLARDNSCSEGFLEIVLANITLANICGDETGFVRQHL
jgi:hypothetical protein